MIRRLPLGVVATDDSTLSLERSPNGEMVACSPEAVSPQESTGVETNGGDDVDSVGMVGEKSTDKISHNTLTSCDHLLSMFYLLLTILVIFSVFI